jgi:hypothetical protein
VTPSAVQIGVGGSGKPDDSLLSLLQDEVLGRNVRLGEPITI